MQDGRERLPRDSVWRRWSPVVLFGFGVVLLVNTLLGVVSPWLGVPAGVLLLSIGYGWWSRQAAGQ